MPIISNLCLRGTYLVYIMKILDMVVIICLQDILFRELIFMKKNVYTLSLMSISEHYLDLEKNHIYMNIYSRC